MYTFVHSYFPLIVHFHFTIYKFSIKESGGTQPLEDIYLLNSDLAVIYTQKTMKKDLLAELRRKGICYKRINSLKSDIVVRSGHPILDLERDISVESLAGYGLVKYSNEVLTYDDLGKNQNIYTDLLDLNEMTSIININNRSLLHNILANTDYISIGTSPAKDQEDLFGIVSLPFEPFNLGDEIEMGVIYLKRALLNPITERFIELLLETYG